MNDAYKANTIWNNNEEDRILYTKHSHKWRPIPEINNYFAQLMSVIKSKHFFMVEYCVGG